MLGRHPEGISRYTDVIHCRYLSFVSVGRSSTRTVYPMSCRKTTKYYITHKYKNVCVNIITGFYAAYVFYFPNNTT